MSTITKLGKVSILSRGDYVSTASYEKLDLVTYNGASYLCREACNGIDPTPGVTTQYWQPFGSATQVASTGTTGIVRPDGSTIEIKDAVTGRIGVAQDIIDNIDAIAESLGDEDEWAELPSPTDSICANITAVNEAVGDLVKVKTLSATIDVTDSNANYDLTGWASIVPSGYVIGGVMINSSSSNVKTLYVRTYSNTALQFTCAGTKSFSGVTISIRAIFVKA